MNDATQTVYDEKKVISVSLREIRNAVAVEISAYYESVFPYVSSLSEFEVNYIGGCVADRLAQPKLPPIGPEI